MAIDKEALIKDMLAYIDPAALSYSEWVEVGMAIKAEGLPVSIWDSWSRAGKRQEEKMITTEKITAAASDLRGINIPQKSLSGKFLKQVRKAVGLTAKNICEKFGIKSVAELERKPWGVSEMWLKRYSQATGISSEDIKTLNDTEILLEISLEEMLEMDNLVEFAISKTTEYIEKEKGVLGERINKRLERMSVVQLKDVLDYVKLRISCGDEIKDLYSFEEDEEESCQSK